VAQERDAVGDVDGTVVGDIGGLLAWRNFPTGEEE
jgi:hypothetical protein